MKVIKTLIENTDFERIQRVMKALNWTHFDSELSKQRKKIICTIPCIGRLKECAAELLKELIGSPNSLEMSTGGFRAYRRKDKNGADQYGLDFSISDVYTENLG